ncbi:MFS transporter [Nonomuraea africana]|uniref:MFS family permease n=1 Tax=Nonomuraea africana TaxID=46171 RepID=A0ABR9K7K3_9ACTN|nr:MFS transporter [Nonomuraea africana]MBE1557992.1 MFS family permease [Nonomuraea africana]
MTLARLVAVCAVWGVFWGSWSALLPAVQAQVGATTADLGLALAGVPVGAIPAMALTGRLVRGRERLALALATALFALAAAGIGLVTTPLALGLALVGLGATSGALDIALNTATGRAERESGGRLFQPVHAAFPVAVIVAAPATGLARSLGYGPAQVLAVVAVLVLACAVLALGLPLGRGVQPVAESRPKGAWKHAALLGALAAGTLVIENSVEQWSVLLMEDYRAAPTLLASAAPAAYMAALTAGRLTAQAFPRLGLGPLYVLAGFGGGGGIVLAGLAPTALLSLAGFALTGLALGPLLPAMLSRAAVGDENGTLVTAVSTISYAGFVLSPLLVAGLSAAFSLPVALALLGVLAVPLLFGYLTDRSR